GVRPAAPGTARPRACGQPVLAASADREVAGALQQEQVETATKPCHTLDELSAQIRAARSAAAAAAADAGAALVPLGTSPLAVEPTITPRSEEHTSELQSRENLVCRLLLEKKKRSC